MARVPTSLATKARVLAGRSSQAIPAALTARWTTPSHEGAASILNLHAQQGFNGEEIERRSSERLERDRARIIPWLNRTRSLQGAKIIEVGSGRGASTVAMAEQGAVVRGIDVDEDLVAVGRRRCDAHGIKADLSVANASDLSVAGSAGSCDWLIFWAALEHMTLDERLSALSSGWELLAPGGLMTVIETPNRLWYHDSHTSKLPYYMWLPDDLAFRYAKFSPRKGFRELYDELNEDALLSFQRRGRGVSHHDFEIAIAPLAQLEVVSCMQLEERRKHPLRAAVRRASKAGRYEAMLHSIDRATPLAFLQPFLYLTLRKPTPRSR